MPVITSYQILERTPRGNGTDYVRLRFVLDNGEVLDDGVRFLPSGADLNTLSVGIGQSLLDAAAQAEAQQWLSN